MTNHTLRPIGGLLLAAGLVLMTGCAGPDDGASSGSALPAAQGDLSMWGLTSPTAVGPLTASTTRWNEANPDATIGVDFFANGAYKTKVRTAIGAGQGPTFVYGWGGGVLASYVEADAVVDLDPYLERYPELIDRYLPSVPPSGEVDGSVYALPMNYAQPVMLFFNAEVLDEVGLEPPGTWQELLDAIPVLREHGVAPLSLGGQAKWTYLMWIEYLVDRIGGHEAFQAVVDDEPGAWSHPAFLQAVEMIQDLVAAGGFVDGFSSIAADTNADVALLPTGRAAMILQLAGGYANIKSTDPGFVERGGLGYTTFPVVEGGEGDPASLVGNPSNFWSVSTEATEQQREEAVRYLAEAVFDEQYTQDIIDTGSVPVVQGIEAQLAESDDGAFLTDVYRMVGEAPTFQLSWDQALSPVQAEALLTNLDLVFLDAITPEDFAAVMNETVGR